MKKKIFLLLIILFSKSAFLYLQSGWIPQQSGTTVKLNKVFFINSQTGWVVGDSGKIIKTINGGINWVFKNSNVNQTLRSVYFLNETTGYAVGGNYIPLIHTPDNIKIILKTTDGGNTWIVKYFSQGFYNSLSDVAFVNEVFGFATSFGGNESKSTTSIFKTIDSGENWYEFGFESSIISIQFTNQNMGYLASNYYSDVFGDSLFIFKTSNSGSNWYKIYSLPKGMLYSSNFINNNTGWAAGLTRISGFNRDLILKTTDGGLNWQNFALASFSTINAIYFASYDNGWYCNSGIFKSIDGGESWINQVPSNGNDYYTSIIFIDNKTGWAVGNNGKILKTITGGVTSINPSNGIIPDNFSLNQNYPNPFNPTTNINFSIPKSSFVTLKVYNVIGKEIADLINENLNAGVYSFDFNADGLATGVYLYKLIAGDYSAIKKMTVLK